MSEKFVVKGGLSIPTGKKLELQGTEVDASAAELNVLNTFALAGINTDNAMASASSTTMASDASVKAYVDAQLGASVLTFTTDTEGNNDVDLDDDTLTLSGGDGISVTHDGDEITFATEFASTGDTNTGTSTTTSVTPAGLTAWTGDTAVVTLGTIGTGTWQGDAIATAYIADDAVTPAKMSIFDDALVATDTHFMIADGTDYSSFAMSGDVTCTNGGVVTIAANAVQTGMVHDDVATELGGTGLTATSGVLAVDASQSQITTLAGATDIGSTGVDTAFAGEVTIDETLTVTGVATVAKGSLLASSDAPTTDAMIANKKYVDDQLTAEDLDVAGDSGTLDIDLDSDTFTIAGTANEIETSANGTTLTIGLPDDVTIGDALSVTGATDMSSTLTVGEDGTGYDVKFFGDTASAYMLWDQSADDLVLAGAAGIDLAGDIDVDGTANLDDVDIDGSTQADGTITVGVDATGYDVKFFGDTASAYMLWDQSADNLDLAGTATLSVAGLTTLTGGATIPTGKDLTITDQPSADTDAANKKYVDDQLGDSSLTLETTTTDHGFNKVIDLDSETLSILGTSAEIETTMSANNTIKIGLPNDVDIAGDLTPATITMTEFDVDASGNTNIDGTLNVEGIPTFQAESVHSAGIDCNGTLSMELNEIQGSADNMLMRAGSTGDDYSFSGTDQLALQADSGIVLVSAVECGGDIVSDTNDTDSLGSSSKRWSAVHSTKVDLQHGRLLSFSGTPGSNVSTAVFSFQSTDFKSAKVSMTVSDGTDYTAREFLMVCDENGANPALVEYGVVSTGSSTLGEFDIAINGAAVELKVTNAASMPCTGTVQCQE